LYFLLTGRPPAAGGALEPPRRLDRGIPRPLEAVCLKALAREPGERYPDVRALAADVSHYLSGLAVAAYPERPWERAGRFVRAYRAAILLVLAYLAMRLVLLLWRGF
jgi:serine/threonine-protein kinase